MEHTRKSISDILTGLKMKMKEQEAISSEKDKAIK